MSRRDDFDKELREVLGSNNTYFQPPESVKLEYPCIRYSLSTDSDRFANDRSYIFYEGYEVTVISKDPDQTFKDELKEKFRHCSWNRSYVSDNLNHNVYKIYY